MKKRDALELEKEKTALYNLVFRYFVINFQRSKFTPTRTYLIKDKCYIKNYIIELHIIASKFDKLITTSYDTELYKRYPTIGVISTFLRKEMMMPSYNNLPTYNAYVFKQMFSAFDELKKDTVVKKQWLKTQRYIQLHRFLENQAELKTTLNELPFVCFPIRRRHFFYSLIF